MRSIHKASVSFGLVNVPVKLFGATDDHDVKAHLIHAADGGQIRFKKICEVCGALVEQADLGKAYDHEDQTVVLTTDDLTTIAEESNRRIEVLEFIPASDLDPMMFDRSYYLGPDGSDKAYTLLATTLARSERVAIVQFAMRGKTRLAALRVTGKQNVIVVHTLLWPDEMRHPEDIVTVKDVEVKEAELDLADLLVQSMANEFNPDRYRDLYQEQLRDLIAAKANGETITPGVVEAGAEDVADLLAALEASVSKRKKAKK